jgi:trans-aconitate methyltransferase
VSDTDQIRTLRAYYLHDNDGEPSIFHIWEKGSGRGDVTTPATSSSPYRRYVRDLLRGFLTESPDPALLSLGCGNGMIEAALVNEGFRVLGVDALEHAVELATAKGVNAVRADVLSWTPPPGPWTVIYADGILGHLYDAESGGLRHVIDRLRSWLPAGGALVLSNDPPRIADVDVQENPKVAKYFWFAKPYLHRQVEECGFRDVTSTLFTYQKPLSGPRDRVIVTARR